MTIELPDSSGIPDGYQTFVPEPHVTGRKIVMFRDSVDRSEIQNELDQATGGHTTSSMEEFEMMSADQGIAVAARVLNTMPMAVIEGSTASVSTAMNILASQANVVDVVPEFWMHATAGGPPWPGTAAATWGLHAVGAVQSLYDGTGIKVAVLDTGFALSHPDFLGRKIITRSFVPNETVDDVQGHGTHCAGTIAGPRAGNGNRPGYGVAPGVDLYIGKVLGNNGSGRTFDIIDGMDWAIAEGCHVISMSLGRAVTPGEPFEQPYEVAAAHGLARGSLVIAAAGNESDRRFNYVAPVSSPANCPSIMAVAAIGSDGGIASFSCGGTGTGKIDVCGPGVAVMSSMPPPRYYSSLNGTSMACPHVAAVAALIAQSDPTLRGSKLWNALVNSVQALPPLRARDIGSGLVVAP